MNPLPPPDGQAQTAPPARGDYSAIAFLLRRFFRPYWKKLAVLILLNTLTGILLGLQPLTIAPAVNYVLATPEGPAASWRAVTLNNLGPTLMARLGVDASRFLNVVLAVMVLYISVTVVMAAAGSASFVLSARVRSHVLRDLIVALHRHVILLPLGYFQRRSSGDLISRFTNDTTATVNALDGLVRGMVQALIQAALCVYLLVRTDPLLSLATLAIGSAHILVTRTLSGWVKRRTMAVYDYYARMTAAFQETFQGIRIIKSFAAERFDARRIRENAELVQRHLFRFRLTRYAEEPIRLVVDALAVGGMLLLAYWAMSHQRLSMTGFALFVYLSRQAVGPISEISKNLLGLFSVTGGARRMLEMFDTRSDLPDGAEEAQPFADRIELEHADFAYLPGQPVLRDLCLTIRKGEMVAVVGPSGAGKSTLGDLVLRLYDPTRGRVLYDGRDVRQFRQRSYRRRFGVVSQECLLMNASVRDNVAYGRRVPEEQIVAALRVANAWDFVSQLARGLDTEVGDRGIRLSGGQRQRIAIARAVCGRPEILVLDEATSALDSESEQAVQQAIDNVVRQMTAIVIAHRLSTIVHADKVVVLQDGVVEAVGSHADLLERSPTYARLYRLQFAAPDAGAGEARHAV